MPQLRHASARPWAIEEVFGENLRRLRRAVPLKQSDVARHLDRMDPSSNWDNTRVSRLERAVASKKDDAGQHKPDRSLRLRDVFLFSRLFGVSVIRLLQPSDGMEVLLDVVGPSQDRYNVEIAESWFLIYFQNPTWREQALEVNQPDETGRIRMPFDEASDRGENRLWMHSSEARLELDPTRARWLRAAAGDQGDDE